MSAQTRYAYSAPIGAPGGIVDLTPHAIDALINEEDTGLMKPGYGVVNGTIAGVNIKIPASGATAADFAGVVVNGRTFEHDLDGLIRIAKSATVGVMRYGRIYVRVPDGCTAAYGDALKLIITGDYAGQFCATAPDGATAIALKGRFLGPVDAATKVAKAELFNQAQV